MTCNDLEQPCEGAARQEHDKADFLYGMPAIAEHLGMKESQARHLYRKGRIPTFPVGKLICARRSTLNAWLAECEAKARQPAAEATEI